VPVIPQSIALSEAIPGSLSELFSRDPEGYQKKDLDQIIQYLREQRERMELAEKPKPKGSKTPTQAPLTIPGKLEDFDL